MAANNQAKGQKSVKNIAEDEDQQPGYSQLPKGPGDVCKPEENKKINNPEKDGNDYNVKTASPPTQGDMSKQQGETGRSVALDKMEENHGVTNDAEDEEQQPGSSQLPKGAEGLSKPEEKTDVDSVAKDDNNDKTDSTPMQGDISMQQEKENLSDNHPETTPLLQDEEDIQAQDVGKTQQLDVAINIEENPPANHAPPAAPLAAPPAAVPVPPPVAWPAAPPAPLQARVNWKGLLTKAGKWALRKLCWVIVGAPLLYYLWGLLAPKMGLDGNGFTLDIINAITGTANGTEVE